MISFEWHRDIINCENEPVLGGFTISIAQFSLAIGTHDIAIYRESDSIIDGLIWTNGKKAWANDY